MKHSPEAWTEKRNRGFLRYLLIDGILFTGGPFAVMMQVIGVLLLREENETIGQYFTATRTWLTFIAHGTLFGLVIGFINWRRNEKAFSDHANNA
jgi:hypothetical protein